MEYQGRRGRRGRGRSHANLLPSHSFARSPTSKSWSFSGICNIVIMSGLIAVIYLMLEYHCSTCKAKQDLLNITRGIEDIANNLSDMKTGYLDLENKISKFSQELPRIEGQIEILEALSKSLEKQKSEKSSNFHSRFVTIPQTDFKCRDDCYKLNNVTKKICSERCTQIFANQA